MNNEVNFENFLNFYNRYIQINPTKSLEQIIYKYVIGKNLINNNNSLNRFGYHINAPVDTLTNDQNYPWKDDVPSLSSFVGNDSNTYYYSLCVNDGKMGCLDTEKLDSDNLIFQYIERLYDANIIYIDNELITYGPLGTYTYIIGSDEESNTHIYAAKVLTMHELGSKHAHIFYRIASLNNSKKIKTLHYAGEMKISNDGSVRKIEFNFSSGTYMAGLSQGKEVERNVYTPEVITFINTINPNIKVKFNEKNLIINIETPRYIMLLYVIAGFRINYVDSLQKSKEYANLFISKNRQKQLGNQVFTSPTFIKMYEQAKQNGTIGQDITPEIWYITSYRREKLITDDDLKSKLSSSITSIDHPLISIQPSSTIENSNNSHVINTNEIVPPVIVQL